MINKLKQLTARIDDFNAHAAVFADEGTKLLAMRDSIVADGNAMGMKVTELRSMLARVKCEVTPAGTAEPEIDNEPELPLTADEKAAAE